MSNTFPHIKWFWKWFKLSIQVKTIQENHCVYIKRSKGNVVVCQRKEISLYVNDILLVGNDEYDCYH